MRAPFTPIGVKPRWELLYDAMNGLDVGDVLTYDAMAEALGVVEFTNVHRSSFYKAANRWGAERLRAFAAVPTVGYRVVDAAEHEVLARNHHRKSRRQIAKSRVVLEHADRSLLSADEARRFDALERTLGRHADMIRRLEERQERQDAALGAVQSESSVTAAELVRIRELLERHGIAE